MRVEREINPAPSPGSDWAERVVWLWEEDDAKPADRERPVEALRRFTNWKGRMRVIDNFDGGDYVLNLYRGGWVLGQFPEGGSVGVVVLVKES